MIRSLLFFLMFFMTNEILAEPCWLKLGNDPEDLRYLSEFPYDKYEALFVPHQGWFYLDQTDDGLKNILRSGRAWEPEMDELIDRYVRWNSNALDIGAHIGTHTMPMAQAVGPQGIVFAFEPQKKIYRELAMNVRLNQLHNVVVLHCAVGASNKTVFLDEPVDQNEGARFITQGRGVEQVQMCTIDSLELTNISLIKMDVENYELEVLKGATRTILKEKPVILIEIQGNHVQAAQVSSDKISHMNQMTFRVIQYLEILGYKVFHLSSQDYLAIPL